MAYIAKMNTPDNCVSCLVDAQNTILGNCPFSLLHIFIPALLEHSHCHKVYSVHKITFNEAESTYRKANSLLRRYSVLQLTFMNNEPFGKWKTSGEGFGRKLLGLQCLHI